MHNVRGGCLREVWDCRIVVCNTRLYKLVENLSAKCFAGVRRVILLVIIFYKLHYAFRDLEALPCGIFPTIFFPDAAEREQSVSRYFILLGEGQS